MIYNWSQLKSIEIRHFFYYYYRTQSLPINELSFESKNFMIVLRIAYVLAWIKQCKFSATANDYYVCIWNLSEFKCLAIVPQTVQTA